MGRTGMARAVSQGEAARTGEGRSRITRWRLGIAVQRSGNGPGQLPASILITSRIGRSRSRFGWIGSRSGIGRSWIGLIEIEWRRLWFGAIW